MWNPKICDSECDKACKITEYVDIKNYSCKNFLLTSYFQREEMKY